MPVPHRDLGPILQKHGFGEIKKIGEGSFGKALLVQQEDGTKRSQRLPEEQVLRWVTQALLALKYIHERHVLHRDLKSGNFFICRSGNLKMGDFGIAKVLSNTLACARTQTLGSIRMIGTPYYLSPEVCQEKPYAWPSDIWAMGCILYELCALKVPFDAPNISTLVQRICRGPTPTLPSSYSDFLRQLCTEMLHRTLVSRRERRFVFPCSDSVDANVVRNQTQRPSAEAILQRPPMQAMVKFMLEEAQAAQEGRMSSGSQKMHELPPPPPPVAPSVTGPYAEFAGSYRKGDLIEYHSSTHKEWLPAQIIDADQDGRIVIDLKPGTWIARATQALQVRPRRSSPPPPPPVAPPMRQKSPMRQMSPRRQRSPSVGRARDFGLPMCLGVDAIGVADGCFNVGCLRREASPWHRAGSREVSPRRQREPSPSIGSPYLEQAPPFGRPSRAVNAAGEAYARLTGCVGQAKKFTRMFSDTGNPFSSVEVAPYDTAIVVDWDKDAQLVDGDLDVIVNNVRNKGKGEGIRYYERQASGEYLELTDTNPFKGIYCTDFSTPEVVDWDGDGHLDLIASAGSIGDALAGGSIRFFKRQSDGSLVEQKGYANPFSGIKGELAFGIQLSAGDWDAAV
eukprot:g30058.t1